MCINKLSFEIFVHLKQLFLATCFYFLTTVGRRKKKKQLRAAAGVGVVPKPLILPTNCFTHYTPTFSTNCSRLYVDCIIHVNYQNNVKIIRRI